MDRLGTGPPPMAHSWRDQARLRGNAFHQRGTCALAMRIIPMAIPTIAQLGLPPVVADLTDKPHGLILVTGAPGDLNRQRGAYRAGKRAGGCRPGTGPASPWRR